MSVDGVHIPDGYLSPQTCAIGFGATVPFWVAAARKVKKVVTTRYAPVLAIGAAYCFLVMMFNVPIPDGTTAHAVGAVLVACLLGPWAAVIAISIALLIQALFFGDGGVLAYGANCFNMAVVMPMVGYGVYRTLSRHASLTSPKRAVAAGAGGFLGLNAAALCAAVELGLQPELFHGADGTPLYAPFHLSQTIPAMMFGHLLVAGVVEGVLTAAVVAYLQQANLPVLRTNHAGVADADADLPEPRRPGWRWAWIGLATMAALTPLGLIAPGGAFGEGAPQDLDLHKYGLGAVPDGLRHYAGFFHHAIFDGYSFSNDQHPVIAYLVSAVVGVTMIAAGTLGVALVARRWRHHRGARLGGRDARGARSPGVGNIGVTTARSTTTPGWLLEQEVGPCPCGCIGKRSTRGFLDKTIAGGAGVMRQVLRADDVAGAPGLLQRVDPRVKLVSLLGLLVGVAFVHHIVVLAALYLATLVVAAASAIPVRYFVKRVWLFIPVFTGIVVLPATLNVVTKGHVVWSLGSWFGHDVGVTSQGLSAAGIIVARVAVSISLVVLLTLTTSWPRLLAALRSLWAPRIFILVLGMTYRFVFVLLDAVDEMFTARKARTVNAGVDVAGARRFVAASAGALFGRAHALSDEVHQAMVARGWTGDARTLRTGSIAAIDLVWLATCVAGGLAVIGVDRIVGV